MKIRAIKQVVEATRTLEGAGFLVHRPFPSRRLPQVDPFLLFDEMGPMDTQPGEAKGAPDHPHRGFETVTYMLSGGFQHKDSAGHSGSLKPGDVQWMTAGRGVVHSEEPSAEFQRTGGRMHGVQLWVNLPRTDKMMPPRYQEIPGARIPSAQTPDGKVSVRVLAGESLGARAVIETRTPIFYLDFTIQPGAEIQQPAPENYNVFAYVLDGALAVPGTRIGRGNLVLFENSGDHVRLQAAEDAPVRTLLIGGAPLNEPVARYGPFVMNTEKEIHEAIEDYQAGRMGQIDF